MEIAKLKSDLAKERDGVKVWLDDETWLLVARVDNPRYREAAARLTPAQRRAIASGRMSAEKQQEVVYEIYAESILLGWEGLTEKGKPLPYHKANAQRVLREYRFIWDEVDRASRDDSLFLAEEEGHSGNVSKKSSSGS